MLSNVDGLSPGLASRRSVKSVKCILSAMQELRGPLNRRSTSNNAGVALALKREISKE